MARTRSVFVCQACGAHFPRWMGQCTACGAWNVLEERLEAARARRARPTSVTLGEAGLTTRALDEIEMQPASRLVSGIGEWDRVLGGGIVPGSVVLIGGDPGVGKSTLLMQVADAIGHGAVGPRPHGQVLYVSGEESLPQVGLRARRLGLAGQGMRLAAETDVAAIAGRLQADPPLLAVVDSIQSVYEPGIESTPGSVSQLRECTLRLHQVAKEHGVAVLLIGHVTKEGALAGPRLLEHMVDAVLYLEGERLQAYRLLRSVKNRFGATSEVGVFEMRGEGLTEVVNPSAAFLEDRVVGGSGSAIVVMLEGTRPMLVEVQALVTRSHLAVPRRMTAGIDYNRLILLTAVLSKRGGVPFHDYDVHVNVVGGLRLEETAADLGTALAMLSSFRDSPLDPRTIFIGEVGLAGELRGVGQLELRLREAAKLGFRRAIVPRRGEAPAVESVLEVIPVGTLREAALHAGVQ